MTFRLSVTIKVFVAGSIKALPRPLNKVLRPLELLLPLSSKRRILRNSSTFLYFNWKVCEYKGPSSAISFSACKNALSFANNSSRGAILMMLPWRRISKLRACITKSNAWSQGTSLSDKVILPFTVSLATILTPDSFARICRIVRTSTSWKSKEILRPLNDLFELLPFKPRDSVSAALGKISKVKCPAASLVRTSQFVLFRMISWVSLPIRFKVIFFTGVLKSPTSKLRCACVGNG